MHAFPTRSPSRQIFSPKSVLLVGVACVLAAGCGGPAEDAQPPLPLEALASAHAALTLVTLNQTQDFSAPPPVYNYFGTRLALDGDTAVVGQAGPTLVFSRETGTWQKQGPLVGIADSGFSAGNLTRFALSGDTLVASDPSLSAYSAFQFGGVFVFVRTAGVFTQQQFFHGVLTNQALGLAVAVSGDTLAIGDHSNPYAPGGVGGTVHVYVRSGTSWTLQQSLPRTSYISQNGLVLEGNQLAVGSGSTVAIYDRSFGRWSLAAELANPTGYSSFGHVVALSKDTLAVSAAGSTPRKVLVYERRGGGWAKTTELAITAPGVDNFGDQIALDGDTLLVGAGPTLSGGGGVPPVYLFQRRGGLWEQTGQLVDASGSAYSFGGGLAISGRRALVSTPSASVMGTARAGVVHEYALPVPTFP